MPATLDLDCLSPLSGGMTSGSERGFSPAGKRRSFIASPSAAGDDMGDVNRHSKRVSGVPGSGAQSGQGARPHEGSTPTSRTLSGIPWRRAAASGKRHERWASATGRCSASRPRCPLIGDDKPQHLERLQGQTKLDAKIGTDSVQIRKELDLSRPCGAFDVDERAGYRRRQTAPGRQLRRRERRSTADLRASCHCLWRIGFWMQRWPGGDMC